MGRDRRHRETRRRALMAVACGWASLVLLLSLFAPPEGEAARRVTLYLFSARGCSACAEEKAFLAGLGEKYGSLEVREFEIAFNPDNAKLMVQVAGLFGARTQGAPMTFIGTCEPITGYEGDEVTGALIEERVRDCLEQGCEDPVAPLVAGALPVSSPRPETPGEEEEECDTPARTVFSVPFVGATDVSTLTLPVLTLILAALDSFNPCAFFVLFTLLGILVHARSRPRMFFIGGTFVLFSGLIYFLFMAAWLNVFMYVGEVRAITQAAGITALFIAVLNVKDFFFFRRGVSLVIPDGAKPGLFERMRALLKAASLPSMVLGTVVLAAAANAYELFCTAGFPLVFTRILTLSKLPPLSYYLYLALYNAVYVIPLAAVVAAFAWTLGSRKLSEWHGQVMKLVSGLMMLCLGTVLLTDPSLFSNVYTGVMLLGAALLASGAIIVITKRREVSRQVQTSQGGMA